MKGTLETLEDMLAEEVERATATGDEAALERVRALSEAIAVVRDQL